MSPDQFLDAMLRHRAVAIFRGTHQGRAAAAMEAAVGAGFRLLEFTVNTPGDAYEQEADRVADQVMRMQNGDAPVVQRMPITSLSVQRKCAHCEKEEKAMRKETGGGDATTYQPMNVNFGLFPPLSEKVRKADRKRGYTDRAKSDLATWLKT